jgi:tryptophan-rich sensory protein
MKFSESPCMQVWILIYSLSVITVFIVWVQSAMPTPRISIFHLFKLILYSSTQYNYREGFVYICHTEWKSVLKTAATLLQKSVRFPAKVIL